MKTPHSWAAPNKGFQATSPLRGAAPEPRRWTPEKKMRLTLLAIALLTVSGAHAGEVPRHNYKPDAGYVPNAETAIQIAVAVWEPIYGKKQIAEEKPYKATLKDGVWLVEGSLQKGSRGGVAEAEISKDTGAILRVSHGQ